MDSSEKVCEDLIRLHLPVLFDVFSATHSNAEDVQISCTDISGDMNWVCRGQVCLPPPSPCDDVCGSLHQDETSTNSSRHFTVIVKMAMNEIPYLKKDEVIPLDSKKILYECSVLQALAELCPGSVPRVFMVDKHRNAIIMEDLTAYRQLSQVVTSSEFNKHLVALEKAAHFLGFLHKTTCIAAMEEKEQQLFWDTYNNSKMRHLMSNLLFDRPLNPADSTNTCSPELLPLVDAMRKDSRIVGRVRATRQAFLTQNDCLCHGDFATDNILVTSDSFKVVDMEFSGVGLRAYDLALFMQMLLLKLLGEHWRTRHKENISQEEEEKEKEKLGGSSERESSQRLISQALRHVLHGYTTGVADCRQMEVCHPGFIDQVCSLIACEMMWTVFGSYVVDEFCGEVEAEQKLLQLAEDLLLHADSTEDLLWNIGTPLHRIFGINIL